MGGSSFSCVPLNKGGTLKIGRPQMAPSRIDLELGEWVRPRAAASTAQSSLGGGTSACVGWVGGGFFGFFPKGNRNLGVSFFLLVLFVGTRRKVAVGSHSLWFVREPQRTPTIGSRSSCGDTPKPLDALSIPFFSFENSPTLIFLRSNPSTFLIGSLESVGSQIGGLPMNQPPNRLQTRHTVWMFPKLP